MWLKSMDHQQFEFGPFRLDKAEHLLLRGKEHVQLPPKAFEMLLLLVESSGHVIEKNVLMNSLWPDSVVEESNLTQNIFLVRRALGDERGEQHYIKTVPRVGYRFIAPVRRVPNEGETVLVASHSRERIVIREETVEHEEDISSADQEAVGNRQLRLHAPPWKLVFMPAIALLILGIGAFAYHSITRSSVHEKEIGSIQSLAVLPFEPLDNESRDRYLGVGMADALITRLSHLQHVSVRPMSSVQKYANNDPDPMVVGHDLSVDGVLNGRIQTVGTRLRVRAQLLSVRDRAVLWTEDFEENYAKILSVQDEVADRLVSEISAAKGEQSKSSSARQHPQNVEAYEAYVKGRYFWNQRTAESGRKAVEYFKKSIEIDPSFARGNAGLADSHLLYASEAADLLRPLGTFEFLVAKAIELDDSLAEPHAALAYHKSAVEWDWLGAETEFARAIALNPHDITARHWHAYNLISMGRSREAIAEMEQARTIDPVSLIINTDVGHIYYLARQNENALVALQKALEMDPNFAIARERLGEVYAAMERNEEAIAELQRARALFGGGAGEIEARLGYVYAASGRKGMAQETLNEMSRRTRASQPLGDAAGALILAGLGEKDQAFKILYQAAGRRDSLMALYKVDPMFDSLRADTRSDDLLQRMNLPKLIETVNLSTPQSLSSRSLTAQNVPGIRSRQ